MDNAVATCDEDEDEVLYRIVLRPVPMAGYAPPIIRLRRFLKAALRQYGLRCVECEPAEAREEDSDG